MSREISPRPFLRWAGSKRKLVPQLKEYWNSDFRRYVEPFVGSACLFFDIGPKRALLNDINRDLVDTYRALKKEPEGVFNQLSKLKFGKESYYELRAINPRQLSLNEAAARFIFLNRYCFNGLYRTNLKGDFNVPYAPTKNGKLPTLEEIYAISKVLQRKRLMCKDFETVLRENTEKGDFVYLDPPYAVSNKRIFRQYGPNVFGLEDLSRLRHCLEDLDKRGIKFLVSYACCEESREVFKNWNPRIEMVQRNIAGFSKNRKKEAELFASNIR